MTVPRVVGLTLEGGYLRLREAGLSVTVREWTSLSSYSDRPVATQAPAPGAVVSADTPVELTIGPPPLGLLNIGPTPKFSAGDFVGGTMADAVEWARARNLNWVARVLPPLVGATQPSFLANYRVARQTPPPGSELWGGTFKRTTGNGRVFRPGPKLILNPMVDTSVPRLSVPAFRFREQSARPLEVDRRGPTRSLSQRSGSVTAIVFTDPSCTNCPRDPTTPVPGLSVEDSVAPRFLISLGRLRRQPAWASSLRAFWQYGEIEDGDLARLSNLQVQPGDAMFVDREGRVAAILPNPVDTTESSEIVAKLRAEPIPPLAELGLAMSRMNGTPLSPDQVPAAFAQIAGTGPGSPRPVYVLSQQTDGARVLAAFDQSGDIVAQAETPTGVSYAITSTTLANLKHEFALHDGVASFGGQGGGRRRSRFVTFALFVLADGFTEVRIGNKTYPVDGNAFVLEGDFPASAVAEFRGPGKVYRTKLLLG